MDTVGVIVVVEGVTLKHEQALERADAMDVSAMASRWTLESQTVASILAAGLGAGARFFKPRMVVVMVSVTRSVVVTVEPERSDVEISVVVL